MKIKSQIIPLPRKDVDTDLIIPADFLKGTGKEGLGKYLFFRLKKQEKDFPFNLKKYAAAQIIVAQENFGCGSSREHAPWALKDWGIKAIIAPSFGDIFYNNSLKNGLLPIVLDKKIVETIFERELASKKFEIKIDVSEQRVILPGNEIYDFEIDAYRKECLIRGMDDLDYLLKNLPTIRKFNKKHDKKLFFDITKV